MPLHVVLLHARVTVCGLMACALAYTLAYVYLSKDVEAASDFLEKATAADALVTRVSPKKVAIDMGRGREPTLTQMKGGFVVEYEFLPADGILRHGQYFSLELSSKSASSMRSIRVYYDPQDPDNFSTESSLRYRASPETAHRKARNVAMLVGALLLILYFAVVVYRSNQHVSEKK